MNSSPFSPASALQLYKWMWTARTIDSAELRLVQQGHAFFHVSGAGHEALAALNFSLHPSDWLHLHYRDKSLLLARGLPISEFFLSQLARPASHSSGRQMNAHFAWRASNVLSMVGPVGNNALQAVGIAATLQSHQSFARPHGSIVVCSVGDGTTQQGEFFEAIAESVRSNLPILFVVEDNQWSISTATPSKTFFDTPAGPRAQFYDLDLHRMDGSQPLATIERFTQLVQQVRDGLGPRLAILQAERLSSHTNADEQSRYRSTTELTQAAESRDPIRNLRNALLQHGWIDEASLADCEQAIEVEVEQAVDFALRQIEPQQTEHVKRADQSWEATQEYRGSRDGTLTMREAIQKTLQHALQSDPRVFLYGQDIEDPKGDVFGITRGLSSQFPNRVCNAPLSESTIVGTCIGRALAGQRPIGFIQFADFLPLAYNQIQSELGSMAWRTNGAWTCPVILMVTCGGYKPGLGPFHSQSLESVMVHVPGIQVVMPSNAADAAGLLNAALKSSTPTIFFYPKACINSLQDSTSEDIEAHWVPLGKARQIAQGDHLTLVCWGNTVPRCEAVTQYLARHDIAVDLFDLRSLSPWDVQTIVDSATRTRRLVVIHEDNRSCGMGAEIMATVAERSVHSIRMRRVVRDDTYLPFQFEQQTDLLPSFRSILQACATLMDCQLEWPDHEEYGNDPNTICALGSGPADESVLVLGLFVCEGDHVEKDQLVAEVEATKGTVEIHATIAGIVEKLWASEGDRVRVQAPLVQLKGANSQENAAGQPCAEPMPTLRKPVIPQLPQHGAAESEHSDQSGSCITISDFPIYLSRPASAIGSLVRSSDSISQVVEGWDGAKAFERTGVRERNHIADGETVVSLAMDAIRRLLARTPSPIAPVSLLVCSTTTPFESTPSVACQCATLLEGVLPRTEDFFAFDLNAACSGYVYGLQIARDHLRGRHQGNVLLITSEVISPSLNPVDPNTCFLFGDAATATWVQSKPGQLTPLRVAGIHCKALADPTRAIHGPCFGAPGHLTMNGIAVARTAYKVMGESVRIAAERVGMEPPSLQAFVPHPGSKRILQNVAEYLNVGTDTMLQTLEETGNTSSSSIPLCLDRRWDQVPRQSPFGITAFGAGYTSGGAVCFLEESKKYHE